MDRVTTSTFYSDTSDGYITSEDTTPTYSLAREGTGTSLTAATTWTLDAAQNSYDTSKGAKYRCLEAFQYYDTSSISDTDVVSAVTISLYGYAEYHPDGYYLVEVRGHTWSGGGLTTADWVAGSSLGTKTLLASFDTTSWTTSGYNDFTSETAFTSYVSLTGNTEVLINHEDHRLGNTPTGVNGATFYSADQTGTTNDPKLVVTHAPPPAEDIVVLALPMGTVAP